MLRRHQRDVEDEELDALAERIFFVVREKEHDLSVNVRLIALLALVEYEVYKMNKRHAAMFRKFAIQAAVLALLMGSAMFVRWMYAF